jgi:hypothetical protein
MYLRDHKILYLHIPRTGGQSVTRFFYDCLGILDQFANTNGYNEIKQSKTVEQLYQSDSPNERYLFAKNNHWKMPGPLILTHMTLDEYVQHGYITEQELLSTKKLVTVRNPYEKIISSCNYRNVAPDWFWLDRMVNESKMGSEKYRHFMRQSDYIKYNGEVTVDEIVRIEDINRIPSLVSERIDVTGKSVPHFHKLPEGAVYKRVIDREIICATEVGHIKRATLDWINDYYHEDFERFGYEKV